MIRLIEQTPPKRTVWYLPDEDATNLWEVECDVCGKKERVRRNVSYGDPGIATARDAGMKAIDYGEFNPRSMIICPGHKDAEVQAKIKELA